MSLAQRLQRAGQPLLQAQWEHPFLRGVAGGSLEEDVFRRWLEQDYCFLLRYVEVFTRLADAAPPEHRRVLLELARATEHDELDLHRSLSAPFGADLEAAVPGPPCVAYTEFLLAEAEVYGTGLAAVLPCLWGYSQLGRRLAAEGSPGRYAAWVGTYADPSFAALADRCGQMLDEAAPEPAAAERAFLTGMAHELAFWDVP